MGIIIESEIVLETTQCSECGIMFAVPADRLERERANKGNGWYCPNGHCQVFTETEVMRLKHRLDQTEAALERQEKRTDGALRQLAAQKGQNTRLKRRINVGVCIYCHRHFENLERHMKTKHSK